MQTCALTPMLVRTYAVFDLAIEFIIIIIIIILISSPIRGPSIAITLLN